MRYKSFPALDPNNWPNSTFHTWFRAHGPSAPAKIFFSFKDLFSDVNLSQSPKSPASSPSSQTVNPSSSSSPAAAQAEVPAMANIPLDPKPFVPPRFQIQDIEGQTMVHRVVLPRGPRCHEEFAIATIQPEPEG
jgi:hypothetical protein